MPVAGVRSAEGLQEGGLQGLGSGVSMSLEQGSHILFKGPCTVCGPEMWLVLFSCVVDVVHVLQLRVREVAQAPAPGVIAVGLMGVCSGVSGGTGDA